MESLKALTGVGVGFALGLLASQFVGGSLNEPVVPPTTPDPEPLRETVKEAEEEDLGEEEEEDGFTFPSAYREQPIDTLGKKTRRNA